MKLVPLTRGAFAIIDDEDWAAVSRFNWTAVIAKDAPIYAATAGSDGEYLRLHHLICPPPEGLIIDHVNGMTLDNRRCNLRACTVAQNAQNRRGNTRKKHTLTHSQYKGVYRVTRRSGLPALTNSWRAAIQVATRKPKHLGVFATEIEAARAYDTAAKQFFGPFARLNFPEQNNALPDGLFFKPQESSECETNRSARATMESAA